MRNQTNFKVRHTKRRAALCDAGVCVEPDEGIIRRKNNLSLTFSRIIYLLNNYELFSL